MSMLAGLGAVLGGIGEGMSKADDMDNKLWLATEMANIEIAKFQAIAAIENEWKEKGYYTKYDLDEKAADAALSRQLKAIDRQYGLDESGAPRQDWIDAGWKGSKEGESAQFKAAKAILQDDFASEQDKEYARQVMRGAMGVKEPELNVDGVRDQVKKIKEGNTQPDKTSVPDIPEPPRPASPTQVTADIDKRLLDLEIKKREELRKSSKDQEQSIVDKYDRLKREETSWFNR